MNEIKIGEAKMIQAKELCFTLGNREVYDSHIGKFETLLNEYGFMDALKVVPGDGCFQIVEGQHRFEAGKRLGMSEFPCYVIDWLDGCDDDEIQNIIISLNANNKVWTIYDFVKSFADRGSDEYKKLKERMIQYRDTLSNGVVASCHTGRARGHSIIRDGNFKNLNNDFSEWLLMRLHQVVISDGKKNFPSRLLSIFVSCIWNLDNDTRLINNLIHEMRKLVASGNRVPDGEQALQDWITKMVEIIGEENKHND
jgi:hypothetical protein